MSERYLRLIFIVTLAKLHSSQSTQVSYINTTYYVCSIHYEVGILLLPNDNTVGRILFQSYFLPLVTGTTYQNYAAKTPICMGGHAHNKCRDMI